MAHCSNEKGCCVYCGSRVFDDSPDTVKCLQEQLLMSNECLGMVAETLNALGCGCREEHSKAPATAPMFYPEWIRCVVVHHRKLAVAEAQNKES